MINKEKKERLRVATYCRVATEKQLSNSEEKKQINKIEKTIKKSD